MRGPTTPAKSAGTSSNELCRTPIPATPLTRATLVPATPLTREPATPCELGSMPININVPDRAPWHGVSLGGWLLLEPGPAKALFSQHRGPKGEGARCEWDLMKILRRKGKLAALTEHRDTYICKSDFERIKAMGLNSVRVPFGYWVVLGPLAKEPYVGPALEYLDLAVQWAEEVGLQVLLDLHGAPGGESAEAPCGRRQRPLGRWQWRHWRFRQSLRALDIVARRYANRDVVTGIAVCNEPAPEVPSEELCRFYDRAMDTIRAGGMPASRVTVVLPVFQRSLEAFVTRWTDFTHARHDNFCFEVHWYHCFENEWHGRTFAQHLRAVQAHARELERYPVLVGEWSLALGCGAQPGKLSREEMRALFSLFQIAAYGEASHGWFFWTWSDAGGGADWDLQKIFQEGNLPLGAKVHELPELPPACEDKNNDPLEKVFDVPSSDPRVYFGDTVYLRAFNGRYLDVEGPDVRARYGDRGKWQQFVLCPFGGEETPAEVSMLRDGDVVCLLAHTGCFLGMSRKEKIVKAGWAAAEESCAFVVHTTGPEGRSSSSSSPAPEIRHRSGLYLQSRSTSKMLAPNEGDPEARDKIAAHWKHFGTWQRLVVEKPLCAAVTPRRPRRRSSFPAAPASPATPSLRRRLSTSLKGITLFPSPKRQRRSSTGAAASPARATTPQSCRILRRSVSTFDLPDVTTRSVRRQSSSASLLEASAAPGTPVRRQSSSGGARETATMRTPVRRQSSPAAVGTPLRRQSSSGALREAPAALGTPLRKRKSDSGSGLTDLPTPSRRRNIGRPVELFQP